MLPAEATPLGEVFEVMVGTASFSVTVPLTSCFSLVLRP
jgi:hypothetical protein